MAEALTIKIGADITPFTRSMGLLKGQISGLGASFSMAFLKAGAATALAGLGAGFIFATKAAADFQETMTRLKVVLEKGPDDLERLSNEARRLGIETGVTATEVGKGMLIMGQAGFKTGEIMAAMGNIMDLATLGEISMAQSADIVTSSIRQFGLAMEDSKQVAADLGYVQAQTNSTIESLGEALKYVGPVANMAGMSLEETTAIIGLLANQGIKGSMAGAGLRTALVNMMNPTKEAAGLLHLYGIKLYDNMGTMKSFTGILREFERVGLTAEDVTAIFNSRAGTVMAAALGIGADAVAKLTAAQKENTDYTHKAAEEIRNTFWGEMRKLWSITYDTAIMFGNTWLPALQRFVGSIKGVPATMGAWADANKRLIEQDFQMALNTINNIGVGLRALGPLFKEMFSGFSGAGASVEQMSADFAVFMVLNRNEFPKMFKAAKDEVAGFVGQVAAGWREINNATVEWEGFYDMVCDIRDVLTIIWSGVKLLGSEGADALGKLSRSAGTVWSLAEQSFDSLLNKVKGAKKWFDDLLTPLHLGERMATSLPGPGKWMAPGGGGLGMGMLTGAAGLGQTLLGGGGMSFDPNGAMRVGSTWSKNVADGIRNGAREFLTPALQFWNEFWEGNSPPKRGPLSNVDKGAANVAVAWGAGFFKAFGSLTERSEDMAKQLYDSLTGKGKATVGDMLFDKDITREKMQAFWDDLIAQSATRSQEFMAVYQQSLITPGEQMTAKWGELYTTSMTYSDAMTAKLMELSSSFLSAGALWADTFIGAFTTIGDGITQTVMSSMNAGQSISDIWKNVGKSILTSLVQTFIKIQIQHLISTMAQHKVEQAKLRAMTQINAALAQEAATAYAAATMPLPAAELIGLKARAAVMAMGAAGAAASFDPGALGKEMGAKAQFDTASTSGGWFGGGFTPEKTVGFGENPGFAEGGYVDRPTLAWVGEGGQGEYIIPENKMPGGTTTIVMKVIVQLPAGEVIVSDGTADAIASAISNRVRSADIEMLASRARTAEVAEVGV